MKESFGNDFNNEFKLKNDSKEYADVILNVPFGFFGGTTLSDPFFKGTTSTGV